MSITNLEKTFENNFLIYCNLTNEIIIECICLTKLYLINRYKNKISPYYICDKVKIITIYDIYKNIIFEPIQIDIFKDPIKINGILENLEEKHIYFFKTFLEVFLINNKLNDTKYVIKDYINYNTGIFSYKILYKNIYINLSHYNKRFFIYNNEKKLIYDFNFYDNIYDIGCYENKNRIEYSIYNKYIVISIYEKLHYKLIYLNKENLKVFKIVEFYNFIKIYKKKINDNNEITRCKKKVNGEIEEEFISNNMNPPFSKPLKKYCIEFINHCNKNITNFIKIVKPIFKKLNRIHYNLLLNYNLEMIDFKNLFF